MSNAAHHRPSPDEADEAAALYAAGAMSREEEAAFEAKVRSGDHDATEGLRALDAVTHALTTLVPEVEPSPELRDAVLRGTAAGNDDDSPQVWRDWDSSRFDPGTLFTLAASAGQWEQTGIDGIEVRRLFVDRETNRMTAMFRMAPGTEYVPHVHDGPEECYVLEGDLHVGEDLVMRAGDYQRAPAGSHHPVQRTEGGCLLLISSSLHDEVG